MHADEIRQLLQASPFRLFTVFLVSNIEALDLLDVALIARVEVQEKTASGS